MSFFHRKRRIVQLWFVSSPFNREKCFLVYSEKQLEETLSKFPEKLGVLGSAMSCYVRYVEGEERMKRKEAGCRLRRYEDTRAGPHRESMESMESMAGEGPVMTTIICL